MISFEKIELGNKTKITFLVDRFFGQKFTRNAKICCFVSKCNFCNFDHPTFAALIQGQRLAIISNLVISVVSYGFPRLNSFCHTAVLPMKVKDESPYCCYVILQVSKCFRLQVKALTKTCKKTPF